MAGIGGVRAKGATAPDTISARRAFVELHSVRLDMLAKDRRLDMLDYYDNGMKRQVANNLWGKASLDTLTADYLRATLTPASTLQIKILRLANGKEIAMTIYTIGVPGEAADSEVAFYDASLSPLPASGFMPTLSSDLFLVRKGDKQDRRRLDGLLPFSGISIEARPGSDTLTARLNYGDIIPKEDMEIVETLVAEELPLNWNSKKFSLAH